ncbi:MAG: DUF3899 domain-containing protein [Treponema sp.]|nr:DUF3899 domain-containing protein [Treponema sp.]MBQ5450816.1 DUF3899 domain-containing protein [Treponema sp.]MBQ5498613.1 DUF3899 domain-containing protein [Treponema sp.]
MKVSKRFLLLALANTLAAFLLAAGIVLYERHVFSGLNKLSYTRLWCDGCFVSAVIFLGSGILVAVSRNGGFDSISYAFSRLAKRFIPLAGKSQYSGKARDSGNAEGASKDQCAKNQSYLEYVKERHADGKKSPHPLLMVAGSVMLLASFILLVLA